MPSATGIAQAGCGLGWPSISMRQARQAATGSSRGWSQNRGISMPTCSAARMIRVPLGTTMSMPSIATVTWSTGGRAAGAGASGSADGVAIVPVAVVGWLGTVIAWLPRAGRWRRPG